MTRKDSTVWLKKEKKERTKAGTDLRSQRQKGMPLLASTSFRTWPPKL